MWVSGVEGVLRVSEGCLEGVWVYEGSLEGVWRLSSGCLEVVWMSCLNGV